MIHKTRFAQIPEWVLDSPDLSDRAVRLYGIIARYGDRYGAAFPKRSTLAVRLGCSENSVDRACRELVNVGALTIRSRRRDDGGTASNEYILRSDPVGFGEGPLPSRGEGPLPSRGEGKGNDSQMNDNQEPKDNPPPPTGALALPRTLVDVTDATEERLVFDAWVESTGKTRSALDAKRRRLIRSRLNDGYTVDDLRLAVTGWQFSPHHRGENDRGTVYNDLGLILRDADHVDAFLEYARSRSGGGRATTGRDPLSGVREFLADRAEAHSFVGEVGRG